MYENHNFNLNIILKKKHNLKFSDFCSPEKRHSYNKINEFIN